MGIERDVLVHSSRLAIVGLSPNTERASNVVAQYLTGQGYSIVPVNPMEQSILGVTSYPELAAVPGQVDAVVLFRRPDEVMQVVEQAVVRGDGAIWMQEGVVNEEAARYASAAGLKVVMNKCMRKEHMKMTDTRT